jgi:hypothetical protein
MLFSTITTGLLSYSGMLLEFPASVAASLLCSTASLRYKWRYSCGCLCTGKDLRATDLELRVTGSASPVDLRGSRIHVVRSPSIRRLNATYLGC